MLLLIVRNVAKNLNIHQRSNFMCKYIIVISMDLCVTTQKSQNIAPHCFPSMYNTLREEDFHEINIELYSSVG